MSNEELAQLIKAGDNGYLPQLWEQVRRFITMQALRFHSRLENKRRVDADDLIQSGYFAVLEAVRYYEPAKGYKFTTYLNTTLKKAFRETVGLRSSRIDLLFACMSLDEPLGSVDGDISLLDAIPDTGAEDSFIDVEESEYNRQLRAALDDALDILEDADRRVVERYYYFGLTNQQIADMDGVTASRVESRKHKALNRIRHSSHRRKLEPFIFWYKAETRYRSTATWGRLIY